MSDDTPYPAIERSYDAWQSPETGWVPITAGYARGWLRPGGREVEDLARLDAGETLVFFGGAFRLRKRADAA